MTIQDIGSRWYKFDFHTHTPASSDHKAPNETEIDWLKALMLAEVDCVALTDHVSGSWINRIKATYAELDTTEEWYRPLHIFPGSEITVSTGQSRVHILAIFDPQCDEATITAVLGQCGIVQGQGDAEVTCATESVDNVIDIVQRAGGIAIPAHIDGPKGLLHEIQNWNQEIERWLSKIEAAECINLQFRDGVNHQLQRACEHLANIQGSDAHKAGDLGWRTTWVKMSQPSIDGLKLALHDHIFCVDNGEDNPNSLPNLYLSELNIEKMTHCGRRPGHPGIFKLHPLFNAVIGGRGSGKSTFIESIRLALGRENEVAELGQIQSDVNSFKQGVTSTDTSISTIIERRSETYRSTWKGTGEITIEKYTDGEWGNDNGDPRERFHVSLYSQKQINSLASNPNSLLEIIDNSDEVNITQWRYDFDQEKEHFLEIRRELRNLEAQISGAAQLHAQLDDVNSDIASFEKGGHGDVFNAYQQLAAEKQAIEECGSVDQLIGSLSDIATASVPDFSLNANAGLGLPDHLQEISAIHGEYIKGIEAIQSAALKLNQELEQVSAARAESIESSEWKAKASEVEENYESVVNEYQERGEEFNPAQYDMWLKNRNAIIEKIGKVEELKASLIIKEKESVQSYRKLYRYRRNLQKSRQKFISDVVGDNQYVRMKLVPFSSSKNVEKQLRSGLGIDNGYSSSIYQEDQNASLIYNLLTLASDISLKKRRGCIEDLKANILALSVGVISDGLKIDKRLISNLQEKRTNQPEILDRLSIWWPDDLLVVEYARDVEVGRFENIEKGSAGQKAAAILAFLLSHGDNPIIVDQPEDDLDNALIYQLIVSQIHQNKKRRQIIMVTHNPNIVVNGDAEYVNVLHFSGGQVQVLEAGGLCEQSIRTHVCEIMEGGTAAFEKRYQRLKAI